MQKEIKKGPGNELLEKCEWQLTSMRFLYGYLDYISMFEFSETCQPARRILSESMKDILLTAVVCGNEDLARKIIMYSPELLLDSSATATDLSGKEIKNITPLQAAICLRDIEMLQMMLEILEQKRKVGINLIPDPKLEIQRQFISIYPNGDIDAVETAQKAKAKKFKKSMLHYIFMAINDATEIQVKSELNNPGVNNTDSQLNTDLHKFREQFKSIANLDQIFNPFYLLTAIEFYYEKFYYFNYDDDHEDNRWNKRNLLWVQVIGYIERHLPACYLQILAQGIDFIIKDGEKLKRYFEFRYNKGFYMKPAMAGSLNGLGYTYASCHINSRGYKSDDRRRWLANSKSASFLSLLRTKKSGLENLFTRPPTVDVTATHQPARCVIV